MRKENQRRDQNGESNRENVTKERSRGYDSYRDEREFDRDGDVGRNRDYVSSEGGRMGEAERYYWDDYGNRGRSEDFRREGGYEEPRRGEYRRDEIEGRESVRRDGGRQQDNVLARRRPKSMNFEEYAAQGNRFIKDVAEELQTDRDTASRVTRAIIHALRDRLPPDDAIQFAQGLPMALKGVFLDQYDISKTPVVIRKADEFLDYIRYKDRFAAIRDFPSMEDVERGLRAVFHVLEMHLDQGQTDQVKDNLPSSIVRLIDPSW